MDWLSLLIVIVLFVAGATAWFYFYAFSTRIKDEFRAAQPDLRITNMSAMSSGNILTIYPEIENVGGGVAHDCLLHMGGWEGHFAIKKVYPHGQRYQKHVAPIVLGPEAPVRARPINNGYIRLRYLDRWGQKYDCWYQVTQVRLDDQASLYNVQVNLEHPEVNEPHPTLWEMRKCLRSIPLYD